MIGIGPFITHQDTPFREFSSGELTLCLRMVAILRHLFPEVLLPGDRQRWVRPSKRA